MHGISRKERISEPVCAQIQTCRISGKSYRSESGIVKTTLGGHILQNSAEPTGNRGDKGWNMRKKWWDKYTGTG